MNILVFRTNIYFKEHIDEVAPHLGKLPGILKWNVDLHDIDKVLRIEVVDLSPAVIVENLKHIGYLCEELED